MLQFAFDALVALFPASLGQKAKANSLAVTIASDQDVVASAANQTNGSQKTQRVDGSGNIAPAGDAAARPIWAKLSDGAAALFDAAARAGFVKVTDGTNTMPTADAAARALFAKITDGTSLLFDAAARAGWVKVTDGTNTQPTMDVAARKGFVSITDGTNTMPSGDAAARAVFVKPTDGTSTFTIKAASTAPATGDTSLVVALSPNDLAVKALTPQGAVTSQTEYSITGTSPTTLTAGAATRGITVQAHPGNTVNVRVGDAGIVSSSRGTALAPGMAMTFPLTNANLLAICNESSATSKVEVTII